MANKNIDMSKLRQILKHYSHHQGTRIIRDLTGISRNTVKKYIAHYKSLKTPWSELSKLSDQELESLFQHEPVIVDPPVREKELYAFFPRAEKRLQQTGMTLELLWKEYSLMHIDAYQISGFYKHYKLWKGRSHPSMRMVHKAGERMFVDFAGKTLQIIDPSSGEIIPVQVFVAILGASQLTYMEAVESQSTIDFITACENALHFFGGAPAAIVPDILNQSEITNRIFE